VSKMISRMEPEIADDSESPQLGNVAPVAGGAWH
jgi:hypothetical protein